MGGTLEPWIYQQFWPGSELLCDGGGTLEPCEKGIMELQTNKWAAGAWENHRQALFQAKQLVVSPSHVQ
eukprot:3128476-Prorocentrum_lima.AAC.1